MNPNIECNVNTCKFNDQHKHCSLEQICVGNSMGTASPQQAQETECDSFCSK